MFGKSSPARSRPPSWLSRGAPGIEERTRPVGIGTGTGCLQTRCRSQERHQQHQDDDSQSTHRILLENGSHGGVSAAGRPALGRSIGETSAIPRRFPDAAAASGRDFRGLGERRPDPPDGIGKVRGKLVQALEGRRSRRRWSRPSSRDSSNVPPGPTACCARQGRDSPPGRRRDARRAPDRAASTRGACRRRCGIPQSPPQRLQAPLRIPQGRCNTCRRRGGFRKVAATLAGAVVNSARPLQRLRRRLRIPQATCTTLAAVADSARPQHPLQTPLRDSGKPTRRSRRPYGIPRPANEARRAVAGSQSDVEGEEAGRPGRAARHDAFASGSGRGRSRLG